jgi:O-antigen ligase
MPALMAALGAVLLAPRRLIMEFPVSLSILGVVAICIASVTWSIDPAVTEANFRAALPATLGVVIVGGLMTLRDLADGFLWTIRIVVAITVVALILVPESRSRLESATGADYAGWHGFFISKNNMAEFLVVAIPTILIFHRPGIVKWLTLGVIGVLLAGSTSATGISAAFFVVAALVWLRTYHNQAKADTRDSTLMFLVSVMAAVAITAVVVSSIATITSLYGKDPSFTGRTQIWEASLETLLERPWLGYGYGALFWQDTISPETIEIWRQVGFRAAHAHNGALDVALQVGLIGLAVFLLLWGSTLWAGWRAVFTYPELGIWIVCIISANLLMSLTEDMFFGWLAVFGLLKMLLIRRDESLRRPGLREQPIDRWAFR